MRHGHSGGRSERPNLAGNDSEAFGAIFFAAVGLLTVLLYLEVAHALVTVAWGMEAVALFVFALVVRERSFRITGLVILLLGIGKILVFDVWSFNSGQKFVTLIAVGLVTPA